MAETTVIELKGLAKSFGTPRGVVRAVRAVDMFIPAGGIRVPPRHEASVVGRVRSGTIYA